MALKKAEERAIKNKILEILHRRGIYLSISEIRSLLQIQGIKKSPQIIKRLLKELKNEKEIIEK